ncbi:hypothetical protein [Mucilaginibacter sp. 10I4]|uniref:hypothetical protein n=1 Tax=Mucilaginibacter sp. 10I4 TaxID=3048580 RepID=UPI002B23C8C8|nr:hypothetical protein [Mucilaginibacter sp. 10I4]MEB0262898.1 hypothetical protein [Mucilaginibacter sp. 10I4]
MIKSTNKKFDSYTIRALTGIQVEDKYNYELISMSFSDFCQDQQDRLKFYFELFTKEDYYIECMVNRLGLGGTLAAITVYKNDTGLVLGDGCHRTYAHMINNTNEFYALLKHIN